MCLFIVIFIISSCYRLKSSRGGGQISGDSARQFDTADIALPDGYSIDVVVTGLTFPTGITFDDEGIPYNRGRIFLW